jgi:hypothetical protein
MVLEVELHVTPAIPDELLQEILPVPFQGGNRERKQQGFKGFK